jgi:hypothetical protein
MAAARKAGTAKKTKATAKQAKKKSVRKTTRYEDLARTGTHSSTSVPGLTLQLDKLARLYKTRGCTVHIDIMDDGDSGRHRKGNRPRIARLHIPPETDE